MSDHLVITIEYAWQRAHAAADALRSEVAALPGAAKQYAALCKLSTDFQEAIREEVEAGIAAYQRLP